MSGTIRPSITQEGASAPPCGAKTRPVTTPSWPISVQAGEEPRQPAPAAKSTDMARQNRSRATAISVVVKTTSRNANERRAYDDDQIHEPRFHEMAHGA